MHFKCYLLVTLLFFYHIYLASYFCGGDGDQIQDGLMDFGLEEGWGMAQQPGSSTDKRIRRDGGEEEMKMDLKTNTGEGRAMPRYSQERDSGGVLTALRHLPNA